MVSVIYKSLISFYKVKYVLENAFDVMFGTGLPKEHHHMVTWLMNGMSTINIHAFYYQF